MNINSDFCGGNIDVQKELSNGVIELMIKRDLNSHFFQWFYFEATAEIGTRLQFHILNAKEASYPNGWKGYAARASTDGENWFTVDTKYEDEKLQITHVATHAKTKFAYFAPYSLAQHDSLVTESVAAGATHNIIGKSVQGLPIDKLSVGEGKLPIWIIGRQHPGETMAEWWMQGFIRTLLDSDNEMASKLKRASTLHIVPNMNPDGSRLGNLRTNAAGANLNREWLNPSLERSPEVYWVREEMFKTGVSMCLDVHGDEGLPYNFLDGPLGIPSITPRLKEKYLGFVSAYIEASDEMQDKYGYTPDQPGKADMRICTNWIAETFACLSATLEQPFKDNANAPQPETGWSPNRCARLGADGVEALLTAIERKLISPTLERQ